MASTFIFPPNLHSLEEQNELNNLYALNPTNLTSFRPSDLEEFVKGQFLPQNPYFKTLILHFTYKIILILMFQVFHLIYRIKNCFALKNKTYLIEFTQL